jgi:hypothetical protein
MKYNPLLSAKQFNTCKIMHLYANSWAYGPWGKPYTSGSKPLLTSKEMWRKIAEVFSVTKLTKIVKKTSAKTFVFGSRCFCRDYNGTSL